jgi:nickel-dependent lactate racemase
LGFIEPHLMLGFSGARKLVAPGLAAQETIKVLHSPKFMRDPLAVEGSIEDNPLHQELLEISRMARHDFILDVALARDRSIAGVFAGHPEQAHRCGVEFVSEALLQTLDEPVDAAIATAAGYPLDLTFYQAIKGVTAASHIVKPGGHILLMAACEEGVGAPEFRRMVLEAGQDAEFLQRIENVPATIDQWQLEKLAMVTTRQHVSWYVPGVPAEYQGKLWGRSYPTAEAAVTEMIRGLAEGATVAVIPDGPYVLAKAEAFAMSSR